MSEPIARHGGAFHSSLRRMETITLDQMRFGLFALALMIYAFFGTPTPDTLGLSEMIIGLCLIAAVKPETLVNILSPQWPTSQSWHTPAQLFLIYGLSVPLLMAAMHGNALSLIARDIIPLFFFILPLFYVSLFQSEDRHTLLIKLTILIGLCFSVRAIAGWTSDILNFRALEILQAGPNTFLANSPAVLFAALFLLGTAGWQALQRTIMPGLLKTIILALLALLPVIAMALSLQRASLGMIGLSILIWTALILWKMPYRGMRLILPLGFLGLAAIPLLSPLADQLYQKTAQVGLNMRLEEKKAVWNAISQNPASLLFGLGWGGTFNSPAVGGLNVNFTHSLVTSLLLKTGLCGLIIGAVYLTHIGKILLHYLKSAPIIVFALAAPFIIDIFLYAAFKSFDFGLILLLITSLQIVSKNPRRP